MSEPSFTDCWIEYMKLSNQNQVAAEYLKTNVDSLGLKNTQSILTIGPGDGEVDVELMSVLPSLKRYIVLEPNAVLSEALQNRLDAMGPGVQVQMVSEFIEKYDGPTEPVDMVLMVHVCYYFSDTFKLQIQRALRWLNPGGSLVMVHKEMSPLRTEIENLINYVKEKQTICITWSISDTLKSMNIPYKELHTKINLDWKGKGLSYIVYIFTNKWVTDQSKLEKCMEIIKRYTLEGTTKVPEDQHIHIIPQEALHHLT